MKRASITLLICSLAGVATLVALARPASQTAATTQAAPSAEASVDPEPATGYGNSSGDHDDESANESAEAQAQPVNEETITIEGFAYGGATVVAPGQTVRVTNLDSAPHTVTARDGSFDTGTIDGGGETTLTLPSEPGTYEFFCAIHPSMVATVTVQS